MNTYFGRLSLYQGPPYLCPQPSRSYRYCTRHAFRRYNDPTVTFPRPLPCPSAAGGVAGGDTSRRRSGRVPSREECRLPQLRALSKASSASATVSYIDSVPSGAKCTMAVAMQALNAKIRYGMLTTLPSLSDAPALLPSSGCASLTEEEAVAFLSTRASAGAPAKVCAENPENKRDSAATSPL